MDIVERLREDARGPAFEAADEIERLREALKAIACINPSATNSSYVMRDAALSALQQKDSE